MKIRRGVGSEKMKFFNYKKENGKNSVAVRQYHTTERIADDMAEL